MGEPQPQREAIGGPPHDQSAAKLGLSRGQLLFWPAVAIGLGASLVLAPEATIKAAIMAIQLGFLACALLRLAFLWPGRRGSSPAAEPLDWPHYTAMAALHDEVEIAPQLIRRLSRFDYPADKLEVFILLEAHDLATIAAAQATSRPDWIHVVIVPPGPPQTKPRALNYGLTRARGDLVTIYDAEDQPAPGQLREAAMAFAADAGGRLACVQAPLRIRRRGPGRTPFFDAQFAAEYAALFEVTMPAMARWGLPFPLGGTSNHFRMSALSEVGGWDAYNVTEDADLGFRLWRAGWTSGVITLPTWETPPGGLETWLPQRCRWLKGYMQTWGVHTRRLDRLGVRGLVALVMTLGLALAAALIHAGTVAWVAANVLVPAAMGLEPRTPWFAVSVLGVGTASAWLQNLMGARRAGIRYTIWDMLQAPAYWSLLSLAAGHAACRLVFEPHAWDKTKHHCDGDEEADEGDDATVATAGRAAA